MPGNSVPRWHITWGTGWEIIDKLVKALESHPRRSKLQLVFDHEVNEIDLEGGKVVGVSSGRQYSYYFRKMLSLCSIDVGHGEIGEQVTVLWGEPGTRQKEIRAKVARFPYLEEQRNEDVDVNTIPCRAPKR